MNSPIQFPSADVRRLKNKHNTSPEQLKVMVRELFLWMYDHDVASVEVRREGTKALIVIDGRPA